MKRLPRGIPVLLGALALLAIGGFPGRTAAQSPAPASSAEPAASAAPASSIGDTRPVPGLNDTVLLRDGSVYRGVIFELVPGDHVAIMLPSGQTRSFPMADVRFAGAVSQMPVAAETSEPRAPAPAGPTHSAPPTGEYAVHLTSAQPDVTFWVERDAGRGQSDAGGFSKLCSAPCDVSLPAGSYRFALARAGESPRTADQVVRIGGEAFIRADIVSRQGARTTGWAMVGVGVGGGLAALLAGANTNDLDEKNTLTTIGVVSMVAGALIGVVFGLSEDSAVVHVRSPEDSSAKAARTPFRLGERLPGAAHDVVGLDWKVRF